MSYQSEAGNIRMALAGDVMLSRSLKPYLEPDYLALVRMLQGSDIAFANLESVVRTPQEGTVGEVMSDYLLSAVEQRRVVLDGRALLRDRHT